MVPDWNNTQLIKQWPASQKISNGGDYNIFIAPTDGYIVIYDCYTNRDYYLKVNGKVSAYHKCMYTLSANGFFMIAKGDYIRLHVAIESTSGTGYTVIQFIPGKITDD